MTCKVVEDDGKFLVIEEIEGEVDSCYGKHDTRAEAQEQCDFENDGSSDCEDHLHRAERGMDYRT
jgi:hypothetical protein